MHCCQNHDLNSKIQDLATLLVFNDSKPFQNPKTDKVLVKSHQNREICGKIA